MYQKSDHARSPFGEKFNKNPLWISAPWQLHAAFKCDYPKLWSPWAFKCTVLNVAAWRKIIKLGECSKNYKSRIFNPTFFIVQRKKSHQIHILGGTDNMKHDTAPNETTTVWNLWWWTSLDDQLPYRSNPISFHRRSSVLPAISGFWSSARFYSGPSYILLLIHPKKTEYVIFGIAMKCNQIISGNFRGVF